MVRARAVNIVAGECRVAVDAAQSAHLSRVRGLTNTKKVNSDFMLLDDNNNVRVVRRTAVGGGWVPLAFALCCCCTIVLVGTALIVGFAFTGNGNGNGGAALSRTRTNNHRVGGRVHGRFSPLQELTQCSGFLDLPNSAQPQVGPACAAGLTGRCLGPNTCGGEFFTADRLSTDDGMGFECTVAASVCPDTDANAVCTCSSSQTTCRRNVSAGGPVTAATFECTEPRTCTFYNDIALNSQPAISNGDCDEFATQIEGNCVAANGLCRVKIETVGALNNDSVPAGTITCVPTTTCTAADATCRCFASACVRCVGGVNCDDNAVQFQCVAASQVPGGAASINGGAALLFTSSLVALVLAIGK